MQHDEFIGQVQALARLDSRGAAESATRATLETLAERLPAGLADNLAAQLPVEVGENIRRVLAAPDRPESGERFDRREFFQRVAARAGADEPKAAHETRAVFDVVRQATTGAVMDKVESALPPDLRDVAETGSTGHPE